MCPEALIYFHDVPRLPTGMSKNPRTIMGTMEGLKVPGIKQTLTHTLSSPTILRASQFPPLPAQQDLHPCLPLL